MSAARERLDGQTTDPVQQLRDLIESEYSDTPQTPDEVRSHRLGVRWAAEMKLRDIEAELDALKKRVAELETEITSSRAITAVVEAYHIEERCMQDAPLTQAAIENLRPFARGPSAPHPDPLKEAYKRGRRDAAEEMVDDVEAVFPTRK